MSYDVISAEYLNEYRIKFTFEDGKSEIIDFLPFTKKGGVFGKFMDREYFKNFKINQEIGTITWGDDEVDVAPETLYSLATGSPLPKWMQSSEKVETF